MRLRSITRSENGNALAIVGLALVVLLGSAALVTDGGYLYLTKQRMVNAVDSAALAAGQELPDRASTAQAVAYSYAEDNGCPASEVAVNISEDHREVRVTATREVPLFFARVLGLVSSQVGAQATARIDPVSAVEGVAPLSISDQTLTFGIAYQLKDSPGDISDPDHGSGWLGPISLGGNGANVYRFNLMYGYDGTLKTGDLINTETGNMSGPTTQSIAYRIDQCSHTPSCTVDHFAPDCPRILLVPVVEPIVEGNQVKRVRILGFSSFLIDSYVESGNENYVKGYFVKRVVSGATTTGAADYGLYGVHLID
ncbi:MAG: hypothetical protein HPY50_04435 [Firmicutes bacterium]|nr:hypothetical protein [Bacillota bacterium]